MKEHNSLIAPNVLFGDFRYMVGSFLPEIPTSPKQRLLRSGRFLTWFHCPGIRASPLVLIVGLDDEGGRQRQVRQYFCTD